MASACSLSLLDQQHLALLRLVLTRDAKVDRCLIEHPIDWERMRQIAEMQCTLGLLSEAMTRLPQPLWPERRVRFEWSALGHQIALQNKELNAALADLVKLLAEEQIAYVVVKGQTLAALYPLPQLRHSGDVDFYVPSYDFMRAKDLIQRRFGVKILGDEHDDKHDSFDYRESRFEMHYRLETFGIKTHQQRFDEMIDHCLSEQSCFRQIGDTNVRILPQVEEVVLVFKHLFNHLLMEGVGLRQFCDLSVLLQHFDWSQKNLLEQRLKEIGYYRAFAAMCALLIKHFGLLENSFPLALSRSDYKWSNRLLHVAIDRGNFGKYNRLGTNNSLWHKIDTARISFGHCVRFLPLAPVDIMGLVPRRIVIALRNRLCL